MGNEKKKKFEKGCNYENFSTGVNTECSYAGEF